MPIVATVAGQIEGVAEGPLQVFRGIPYAAPPVGALRWRAPAPVQSWAGIRPATAFGPACLQKPARQEPERSLQDGPQSEDCLSLNIWTPARQGDVPVPAPVMVWVHGGSFRFGAGSLSVYDGSELAKRGVIVVTLNYRLGLFGTFAHPALHAEEQADGTPGGNYGLLDVIAALHWVKDNISAFGGDPAAITLFGESAGGASVAYLLASPLADGLFQRAIVESGGLSLPEYPRAKAETAAASLAAQFGTQDATALRAVPAAAIRDADTGIADTMPFIDGMVVPDRMRAAFEAGRARSIPLLIGSNDAEAGFFGSSYWQGLPREVGAAAWARLQPLCVGYGRESDDACAQQIASEQFAGVVSRAMARAASAAAPVFAYRFAWVPPARRADTRGAIHTAEIPYVFGHVAADAGADAASRQLSDDLAARWTAFAHSGDPSLQPGDWPQYRAGPDGKVLLIGGTNTIVGANPADRLLDALDALALPARP